MTLSFLFALIQRASPFSTPFPPQQTHTFPALFIQTVPQTLNIPTSHLACYYQPYNPAYKPLGVVWDYKRGLVSGVELKAK